MTSHAGTSSIQQKKPYRTYGGRHACQRTCHPRANGSRIRKRGNMGEPGLPNRAGIAGQHPFPIPCTLPKPPASPRNGRPPEHRARCSNNHLPDINTRRGRPSGPLPPPARGTIRPTFAPAPIPQGPNPKAGSYYPRSSGRTTNSTLPRSFSIPASTLKRWNGLKH